MGASGAELRHQARHARARRSPMARPRHKIPGCLAGDGRHRLVLFTGGTSLRAVRLRAPPLTRSELIADRVPFGTRGCGALALRRLWVAGAGNFALARPFLISRRWSHQTASPKSDHLFRAFRHDDRRLTLSFCSRGYVLTPLPHWLRSATYSS